MKSSLRSMERYLGCLAVQATLRPIADDYVDRWAAAAGRGDPLPDVAELFEAAGAVNVPVLSPVPIDAYLRQCAKTGRTPDPARIVLAIAHAWAEGDLLNLGKTCRCPARRPLFQPPRSLSPLPTRGEG